MGFSKQFVEELKTFIIENVKDHGDNLISFVSENKNITRQSASKYISQLCDGGVLFQKNSSNKNRVYELAVLNQKAAKYTNVSTLSEDVVYKSDFYPLISSCAKKVIKQVNFCFTEILNNAIDHSSSQSVEIEFSETAKSLCFAITDDGVGIFDKIKKEMELPSLQDAIAELVKGGYTSDRSRHAGTGIFFTSRISEHFEIVSRNKRMVSHDGKIFMAEDVEDFVDGTKVIFEIDKFSSIDTADVFDKYSIDYKFCISQIPVKIMESEGSGSLCSRSQAKRLIAHFDRFEKVFLNFAGVEEIGFSFADEIGIFIANEKCEEKICFEETSEKVKGMLNSVFSQRGVDIRL